MIFERHSKLLDQCFEKIRNAKVFVAGAGGLGSTVLNLLTRLGIGTIFFTDFATIDEPDLNRQILFDLADIGKLKTEVAAQKLIQISPHTQLYPINAKLDENFILPKVDVVIDCLDSFHGKFLLDRLCEQQKVPLVHAGVEKYRGQITVIAYDCTPSLRTLYHGAKDENRVRQVFPPTVLVAACIEVSETVKVICQTGNALINRILFFDLFSNSFEILSI